MKGICNRLCRKSVKCNRCKICILVTVLYISFSIMKDNDTVLGFFTTRMNESELVDYLSNHVKVKIETLENLNYECKVQLTLQNNGQHVINQRNWQLYFYFQLLVSKETDAEGWIVLNDYGVKVAHVNGDLFKLAPLRSFLPWENGTSRVIVLHSKRDLISKGNMMPNWYVTSGQALPQVLHDTASEDLSYVGPFSSPKQWKKTPDDLHNPFTPEERFERNKVKDLKQSTKLLLPTPLQVKKSDGQVTLDEKWVIVAGDSLVNEAQYLSESLGLKAVKEKPKKCFIQLELGRIDLEDKEVNEESYILEVNETVRITGIGRGGVFYGIQTMLARLSPSRDLEHATVVDSPRFPYRGFMLDVARNFFDKSVVKRLMDLLASYKLNHLHLHLADDEGWRIEIAGLPELTQVGGRRGHDPTETEYLMPGLGSGPHPYGLGCGYYTQEDYRELLQYAVKRHITIIPEIDIPGHCNAAIKAMRVRYQKYINSDPEKAREYLLEDLQDKSEYMSVQFFKNNVINPCVESSYKFVEHVIKSLQSLHADIQPLKTFHLGGDEVPNDALLKSPACAKFQGQGGKMTSKQLKAYFVKRVIDLAGQLGVQVQAWEDAFYEKTAKGEMLFDLGQLEGARKGMVTVNTWINLWSVNKAHRSHEMANNDYKVILSGATHLYFDHQHEPDPEERGLYWATRFTDLRKVFNYMPQNFWANMNTNNNNNDHFLSLKDLKNKNVTCTMLEKPQNIIGMEAALWGETMRTEEHMHNLAVLRLLAFAERAWHKASWEDTADLQKRVQMQATDWEEFVNHLGYTELKRLEKQGFMYYLPLPGARKKKKHWEVNTAVPNMKVQYSVDKGKTWQDITETTKLPDSPPLWLATRSFDNKRRSRSIDLFHNKAF